MGRKKKKTEALDSAADEADVTTDEFVKEEYDESALISSVFGSHTSTTNIKPSAPPELQQQNKKDSSSYAVTSHSADIITEDIYISDGSIDSDEEADDAIQLILTGSKTGLMRRGLHSLQLHQQPDRVWIRQVGKETEAMDREEMAEEDKRRKEEEELAKLGPAERAARLLQEKQRREQEAKLEARRLENEDNVSRDPLLFSKRTAFDIRFEQIEDKPWQRVEGNSHFAEYFNYDLQENDWLEYAQQQLAIRQELIDASKQKRPPDPSIVPVQPRKSAFAEMAAVTVPAAPDLNDEPTFGAAEVPSDAEAPSLDMAVIAPVMQPATIDDAGLGGAWGAGAAPGTLLAKLIEEQEQQRDNDIISPTTSGHLPSEPMPPPAVYHPSPPPPIANPHFGRPLPPMDRGYRDHFPPPPLPPRGGRGGGRPFCDDPYGGGWKRPRDGDPRGWRR